MKRPSWIGQTLGGRYRIDELLGQGGMSAVFKAYDPNLKRIVAIKLIHPHLADDPKFLFRFEEEATAVAKLRHPNIVQVHDYNHDGGVYYMVQEYVPGETLQERLRRLNRSGKRMQVDDAIHYIIDICNAAGYAHRVGMIHRDIKPANIMLDVQDQAILMDFGIVKMVGGDRHTATGAVVGTALYLPPELIRGEIPDPRSDIYSLGITLFEMVNGRPPFEADSAMTLMMMHLHDTVPDLRQLRPGVPDELISVIEKALIKDRNERYGSMLEMASALRTAQQIIQASSTIESTQVEDLSPPVYVTDLEVYPPGTDLQTDVQPSKIRHPILVNDEPQIAAPDANTFLGEALTLADDPGFSAAASPSQAVFDVPDSKLTEGVTLVDGISDLASISSQSSHIEQESPVTSPQSMAPPPSKTSPQLQTANNPTITPKLANKQYLWIGGLVLLAIVIGGFFLAKQNSSGGDGGAPAAAILPTATNQPVAAVVISTDTPTPTSIPATPTITSTSTPTDTPTPTLSPTPTIPVGVPYSRIIDITVKDQNYVVEYETFEYTEALPGMHVHFFFNTVPVEQAGSPGAGPWYVWGGPRPFDGAKIAERPELATQMCILVANPNHSVQFNTGNCYILPDIVAVAPGKDMACKAGPALEYPDTAQLDAGEIVLVRGISPDESWWNVVNPQNSDDTCWLPLADTMMSGDVSALPLVQPPDLPSLTEKFIEITQITINTENRYVVEYITSGFTEQLPGTHIHFFFNTTPPEQVGMSGAGSRLMYGGPSPFTGYRTIDRPPAATELCALVANPDHSIIIESGNCLKLPDVHSP